MRLLILGLICLLAGCATITRTSKEVFTVESTPAGATVTTSPYSDNQQIFIFGAVAQLERRSGVRSSSAPPSAKLYLSEAQIYP